VGALISTAPADKKRKNALQENYNIEAQSIVTDERINIH